MSREFLPARVVCGPQNVGGKVKGPWSMVSGWTWATRFGHVRLDYSTCPYDFFWDPLVCGTKMGMAPVHVSTMLLGLWVDQYFVLIKVFCYYWFFV